MARLPKARLAVVDQKKITDCLLATGHPAGRAKAAFFQRFGFTATAWPTLRDALLEHPREAPIVSAADTPVRKEVYSRRSFRRARRSQTENSSGLVRYDR
jgi:hypothetical protein